MSHTTTVEFEITDSSIAAAAAKAMGTDVVEFEEHATKRLFDGSQHTGIVVKFKDWRYPVVFSDGKANMDTYNGMWGDEKMLGKFKQHYTAELAKRDARAKGLQFSSQKEQGDNLRLEFFKSGKKVVVTVDPNGEAIADVVGCKGNTCQKLTNGFLEKLGKVIKSVKKPEFHQKSNEEQR